MRKGSRQNDDVLSPTDGRLTQRPLILATVLGIITFAAYSPALRGGFVFDDDSLIIHNRLIHAGDGLYRFWFTTQAPDYWPLTSTLWWLEWHTWGNHAPGYHAISVLLHAVNVILIWLILRRLKIPGGWFAAAIFAIHPVNAATVAWISEQKNTLSTFFYAIAILLYLGFDENRRRSSYIFSLTAFLLALLSKTGVVMLPVVLLLCAWWLHGRLRRLDWLRTIPLFLLSLVSGLATIWFQHHRAMGTQATQTMSFAARLATAGYIPWFYLYKALLPVDLTVIYPKWVIDPSSWASYVPGIILIGSLAVFWWKRETWGRPWLFGLGYFLITLFPVLGFFDQSFHRYSWVADHWQYLSIIGVIALVVAGGERITRRISAPVRCVGVVAILAVLGVGTWRRSGVYADEETLWRDNIAKNPKAWLAYSNLGDSLSHAGRFPEASEQYEQALQINPDYAEAHSNLGVVLFREGKIQDAIQQYEQAIRINPDFPGAHCNLGIAWLQTGRIAGAITQYQQALRSTPDYTEAYYDMGNAFLQTGKLPDAIEQYQLALHIDPDYADAHNNLGKALLASGRTTEAIEHFEQVLRINPASAEAYNNLGAVLVRLGKPDDAITHYEKALQIRPDYVDAHFNLGLALEKSGHTPEAIAQYEQTLQLRPDFIPAIKALARLRNGP
jgi:tetratricopeptide (TPR) repeat protein